MIDLLLNKLYLLRKRILLFKIRIKFGKLYLNYYKICWINPQNIKRILKVYKDKYYYFMRTIKGDWDQSISYIKDSYFYRAFKHRFIEGKKWEETLYYCRLLNMIKKGLIIAGSRNKKELDNLFYFYDLLYKNVKEDRKLKFYYPKFARKFFDFNKLFKNISFAIDRNGFFLLIDGRHRISIAKIINLNEIPAIVIIRHEEWIKLRREIINFIKYDLNRKLEQPLIHPDLQDLPFQYNGISFKNIKENLSLSQGKLIDINAKFGYFCHKFEEEGFQCYAVESNPKYVYFMKKLRKAENKQFKIIDKSIFDCKEDQILKFDVVLAFNGFNDVFRDENTYSNFVLFLKKLETKVLFLGIPNIIKINNSNYFQNFDNEQIINLIIDNSCLTKVKFIKEIKNIISYYIIY